MIQEEIDDIMEVCPWRERPQGYPFACTRYIGTYVPCDGCCAWVADYPRLKELENNINKRKQSWSVDKFGIMQTKGYQ